MENKDKEFYSIIAEKFSKMSEDIIKRNPPFNRLSVHKEVSYYLYNFLKYYNELGNTFRYMIENRQIDLAKYLFYDCLVGDIQAFGMSHPQHAETEKAFNEWIKKREANEPRGRNGTSEPVKNVSQLIKKIMMKREPEFQHDKSMFRTRGFMSFSKPWLLHNKVYIVIDKGTYGDQLGVLMGIQAPTFLVDIANFFSHTQSRYQVGSTATELEGNLNKAMDLVDQLMPHFLARVRSALAQCKIEM